MMTTVHARKVSSTLLGDAVHRNRAISFDGLLERLFTSAFRGLVYPQIWEDPRVDLVALALEPTSRVVAIASGGCNVLAYLTADPERIYAVDLNAAHVALNRLKFQAVRRLPDHARFFELFGTADDARNRAIFDGLIEPHLDSTTRTYWTERDLLGRPRITAFGRGFYRTGLLGCCIAAAHITARLHGKRPRHMMHARTRAEQIEIFEEELAPLFERRLVRWALGHRAALYGLGIPPAQYEILLGDAPHMADVVRERLRKLACDFDLTDNYFAWQAFSRGYARDGRGPYPLYLQAEQFGTLKSRIDRVSVELESLTGFLARQPSGSLDRYVLLDAQDWMCDDDLTRLWIEITRTARPGSRVIFRTAGRQTILPGRVPSMILDQWRYEDERSSELLAQDRSAIYGGFHLYVLQSR
jgi:S-adenosylmethionine-diacylglycerol 3-amino-3-carboxypropyl transferase